MILLLCLLLAGATPADPQPIAALTQATGEVMVRQGQAWARVDIVPVNLSSGDAVATDRGRAEVHFLRDDSTLVLDVGTHLTITEAEEGTAGKALRRIEIFLGDVWFQMTHNPNRKTELATPTAVGGLRGTQGLVHVENQAQSQFTLAEGELEVARRSGPAGAPLGAGSVTLRAGQELHALRGKPLETRAATTPPVRPAVKVPVEQLPKPRQNWRKLLPKEGRPAAANKVPTVSGHAPQAKGAPASKPKSGKQTPPPKKLQVPGQQRPSKKN
jgi:hypothetical protein